MSTYLWLLPTVTVRTRESCLELQHDDTVIQFEGLQGVGTAFIRLLDGTNIKERISREPIGSLILPVLRKAGWIVTSFEPPATRPLTNIE